MSQKHKHHRGDNGHRAEVEDVPQNEAAGTMGGEDAAPRDAAPAVTAEQGQTTPDAESTAPEAKQRTDLDALRDQYLRTAADFENYRKRVEREKAESWTRAQADLTRALLDALDDLQRIADFDPETTSARALHEGAEMVERKFLRALEGAGLEVIDAAGKPFDPNMHEALTTVATDARDEDDTVADVFQKGYRFKGVLLRPARVRVKKHA